MMASEPPLPSELHDLERLLARRPVADLPPDLRAQVLTAASARLAQQVRWRRWRWAAALAAVWILVFNLVILAAADVESCPLPLVPLSVPPSPQRTEAVLEDLAIDPALSRFLILRMTWSGLVFLPPVQPGPVHSADLESDQP